MSCVCRRAGHSRLLLRKTRKAGRALSTLQPEGAAVRTDALAKHNTTKRGERVKRPKRRKNLHGDRKLGPRKPKPQA